MRWRRVITFGALLALLTLGGGPSTPFRDPTLTWGQVPPPFSADFNGDAFGDLAVGVPGEDVTSKSTGVTTSNGGQVHAVFGPVDALSSDADGQIVIDSSGFEEGDFFGQALAVGDFDGDGDSDLAVGHPLENVGSVVDAGAVNVFYGSSTFLGSAQVWHQDSAGVLDLPEANDHFGWALAAGDFDDDGYTDLAIAAQGENAIAGAVHILYGSPAGLTADRTQLWSQSSSGILDEAEAGDGFGWALAVGDLNGDLADDLAIGVPLEDIANKPNKPIPDAGAVNVLYGTSGVGLTESNNQLWMQGGFLVDPAEAGDNFGWALASGDFDEHEGGDLAVGVPGEDVGTIVDAGAVFVFRGFIFGGLASTGSQFWHQDVGTIEDDAETGDRFGFALAAGDFNGDNEVDLAVGVPYEDVGTPPVSDAGAVNVIYGSPWPTGLSDVDDQVWSQASPDIPDEPEANDRFGWSLGVGEFNGGTLTDLAIGVPYEDVGFPAVVNAGAVHVLISTGSGVDDFGSVVLTQDSPFIADTAEANDSFGLSLAGR